VASGVVYTFGPFVLDSGLHRLSRDGARVAIGDRHVRVLACLLTRAGTVVSKDALVASAWDEVAVTDNSLEQAVSALRRVLGPDTEGRPWIETVPRQGYRFVGPVAQTVRAADDAIDALLAPHRAFIDGRAALESLERHAILRARGVFDGVVAQVPHLAPAHVGLANACVLQFEMTRADAEPDVAPLSLAVHHARTACGLDPEYGEAWATLGFVLERTGQHIDALAAVRRAVSLEPDNWRHHLRLASVGWGEERLRAARRTLALLPGCALAHWLAATVLVARQTFDDAERELRAGLAAQAPASNAQGGFGGVGLHWLLGLLRLAAGDGTGARAEFERELALEHQGHLYARECCANAWYAIGAQRIRDGRHAEAGQAFAEALARVARHPMAHAGVAVLVAADLGDVGHAPRAMTREPGAGAAPVPVLASSPDAVLAAAAAQVAAGHVEDAVARVSRALDSAPPGNAFWLLPVEPLIGAASAPTAWAGPLARIRARAS
jgi:DNA-binding winged helix-turn-helix (wHTH) protein